MDILADKLYKGGKITDKCEKAGFYERLTLIENQFKGSTVLLHKMGYLPQSFRDLWSNNRLLNVVEQFIGPNISGENRYNYRNIVLIRVCMWLYNLCNTGDDPSQNHYI